MTTPDESAALVADIEALSLADPEVAAHVVAIRDRFGVHGLRSAAQLIQVEIALAQDALRDLEDLEDLEDQPGPDARAAGSGAGGDRAADQTGGRTADRATGG